MELHAEWFFFFQEKGATEEYILNNESDPSVQTQVIKAALA